MTATAQGTLDPGIDINLLGVVSFNRPLDGCRSTTQYTAFLWLLLETITNTAVVPPSFKDDREIECLVDKDLDAVVQNLEDTTPKESNDG